MGRNKDIGTLFEKNLNQGKIAPNPKLWEKISLSWEREMHRRKRNLLYWIVGGGILLSLGLLILINNENVLEQDAPVNKNNTNIISPSNTSSKSKKKNTTQEVYKEDSLTIIKTDKTLLKSERPKENFKEIEIENSSKINQPSKEKRSNNKSKNEKQKEDNTDENYKITTNYHYYNSENEKHIVTTDKSLIDSLVSRKQQVSDSSNTKKQDSLLQKTKP